MHTGIDSCRVGGGDEKGSLKSERVKWDSDPRKTALARANKKETPCF
jgi:hypothetical protein